jgi:TPP-dependent pyruvate/acetoin dehydrogenase alpha subunit
VMPGEWLDHDLLGAYRQMLEIRGFEERAQELFAAGAIRGSIHLGIGQEAVAVGARRALREGDSVVPTYRGHAYALAWGVTPLQGFGELLGRETGSNRGRGGSKHFASAQHRVLPCNAIVAAGLPIACGVALAARLGGREDVTLAPFGDGATNQAAFHEALNQAAVWDLPVVFLCENNMYSEMTPISAMVRVERLADRAAAYGMPGIRMDGMDVGAVADAVGTAAERARNGDGPTLIEAMTYRFCGHMPGDSESYRTREEVDRWRERDPLLTTEVRLGAVGIDQEELIQLRATVEAELDSARDQALAGPQPSEISLGAADFMEWER